MYGNLMTLTMANGSAMNPNCSPTVGDQGLLVSEDAGINDTSLDLILEKEPEF